MKSSKKFFINISLIILVIFGGVILLSNNIVKANSISVYSFSPDCNGTMTISLNKSNYAVGETITASGTATLTCSGGTSTQTAYTDTTNPLGTSHPLFSSSPVGSANGSSTFTAVAGGGSIYFSYQIGNGSAGGSWAYDVISYTTTTPPSTDLTCDSLANPANTTGGTSTISWTSTNADFCNSGGHGTGISGAFPVTPSITTTYPISCTRNATTIPGVCSGTYTVSSGTCGTGYQVVAGSVCGGVAPGSDEGDACSSFTSAGECHISADPWCHHGCTWHSNNTTVQCSELTTQSQCVSHSTCTWGPGSTVPSATVNCDATVNVKTVTSSFYPSMSKSMTISPGASVQLNWNASGFSNNYPATAHCDVHNSDGSITKAFDQSPLSDRPLYVPAITIEPQSVDNNFTVICYEDSSKNTTSIPASPDYLSVTNPNSFPDLIPGAISPTTATPGTTVTFSATITNSGTASAVAPFTNIFQTAGYFDEAGNPVGLRDHTVPIVTTLNAGDSTIIQKSIGLLSSDRYIRVCADKSSAGNTGVITESNENNNCSSTWLQLVTLPDLTAYPTVISPSSGITTLTSITLSSLIKNNGSSSTSNSFLNIFQMTMTDPNGGSSGGTTSYIQKNNYLSSLFYKVAEAGGGVCSGQIINDILPAISMSTLSAGGSNTITKSGYHFPSDGTFWIRACADKSSQNNTGTISESNENNNCGAWVKVTVGVAPVNGVCDCTHYNCSAGTSTNHGGNITNYLWDCVGTNGGSTDHCSETMPPVMSGTLTAQTDSCTILKGDSSCKIKFNWTVVNAPANTTTVVTKSPPSQATVVGTGNINNKELDVKYNNETFSLLNGTSVSNATLLATKTVNSDCEYGSTWNGSVCFEKKINNLPDLITSTISPTTVEKDTSFKFSTTITNQGNVSTVAPFYNFLQIQEEDPDGGIKITDISPAVQLKPYLDALSSEVIDFAPYTFTSVGTKQVRACADKNNSSSNGVISESDENNNCGSWTNIEVVSTTTPVDGVCSSTHYNCSVGTSINNVHGSASSDWKWDCEGLNQGLTVSCTEPFIPEPGLPDLTAQTEPLVASTKTFDLIATIRNQGDTSTVNSFYNFFQIANDDQGLSGLINVSPSVLLSPSLGPLTSKTISKSYTLNEEGTKYFRACADKSGPSSNGSITESDELNNCSSWVSLNVVPAPINGLCSPTHYLCAKGTSDNHGEGSVGIPWTWDCIGSNNGTTASCSEEFISSTLPDLIAGATYPSTVSTKEPVVFSVSITNQGNLSTEQSFMNIFQIADDAQGENAKDFFVAEISPYLDANTSQTIQTDGYNFDTPGKKYIRACADKKDMNLDGGNILESNEDNNCGPWTSVLVVEGTIDGKCSSPIMHYFCSAGVSDKPEPGSPPSNPWTWICKSTSGGGDVECSEPYTNSNNCEDPNATNYNGPLPCIYGKICKDPNATNYGGPIPCTYPEEGKCEDPNALNSGEPLPCTYGIDRCNDPSANNFGKLVPCVYSKVPKYIER